MDNLKEVAKKGKTYGFFHLKGVNFSKWMQGSDTVFAFYDELHDFT